MKWGEVGDHETFRRHPDAAIVITTAQHEAPHLRVRGQTRKEARCQTANSRRTRSEPIAIRSSSDDASLKARSTVAMNALSFCACS